MEHLTFAVYTIFGLTLFLSVWLFFKASNYSRLFIVLLSIWILLQSVLGVSGFYSHVDTMPGRFPLLFLPTLIFLLILFITPKGKAFIDSLNIKILTLFHIIRIPVEIVLFMLFVAKLVPRAMTFEGRNFDILSGVSAILIYYLVFVKRSVGRKGLLVWNIACILLLLNIVSNAILALPNRYQLFNYEQPNVALGYFPFLLLPACLVPLVLFAHLAAIRQLVLNKSRKEYLQVQENDPTMTP